MSGRRRSGSLPSCSTVVSATARFGRRRDGRERPDHATALRVRDVLRYQGHAGEGTDEAEKADGSDSCFSHVMRTSMQEGLKVFWPLRARGARTMRGEWTETETQRISMALRGARLARAAGVRCGVFIDDGLLLWHLLTSRTGLTRTTVVGVRSSTGRCSARTEWFLCLPLLPCKRIRVDLPRSRELGTPAHGPVTATGSCPPSRPGLAACWPSAGRSASAPPISS